MRVSKRKITGQGMTEYIIIVALIAIAAIGVFTAFGDVVRGQVGTMAQELAGDVGTTAETTAGSTKAGTSKAATTLKEYSTAND